MHVVSVCLHYCNIIWLPWQRPLPNRKITSRFIICTESALIWCKGRKNRFSISRDIQQNTPVFWPCHTRRSQMSFVNWTEFHAIFTRYKGFNYTVNVHTEVEIFHSVYECQRDTSGEFAFFHQIGCHGNVPRDIGKRGINRSSAPKMFSFREKIVKIGPAHPEIIVLYKSLKTRNAWQSLAYSPLGVTVLPLASSSEPKTVLPSANVERMHLLSVCLHYGNIISLPWQHPLRKLKIRSRFIICT